MQVLWSPSANSRSISQIPAIHHQIFTQSRFPFSQLKSNILFSPFSPFSKKLSRSNSFTTTSSSSSSSTISTASQHETAEREEGENFDWYAEWYPVMPVCDLDKRVPQAKRVIGLDIVVWWDRNEGTWKVFEDTCPHRLAPLSEGRIDQWGRLQCVYHGWCFNGSGDCKFIPQASLDGFRVHTSKKACVAVYPSTVHHDIVWFWPSTDPQYKEIIKKKQPPSIPELDDPAFSKTTGNRDIPYGYEILIENLMDPSHVPYAHYGIMRTLPPKVKADREGGSPVELSVKKLNIDGFIGSQDQFGTNKFIAPCTSYAYTSPVIDLSNATESSSGTEKLSRQQRVALVFFCVPVSPGNSRLIWVFPRNFGVWIDKVVPRWILHMGTNLVLDSDMYLLHLEEHKIMDAGPSNWQKACFVPTKADALVVGFRGWLNKYAGGQVDWRGKFSGTPSPTPPKEQLMDRYWTHVVNCPDCKGAYKSLNAVEIFLQVASLAFIGIAAGINENITTRNTIVAMAIICFAGSKLLGHFIFKNFHYHGYSHALL